MKAFAVDVNRHPTSGAHVILTGTLMYWCMRYQNSQLAPR
jgi:hypothetical protein